MEDDACSLCVQDFLSIDQFLFAFELKAKSSSDGYDFEYIVTCPVREPFNHGTFRMGECQTEKERSKAQKSVIKTLQRICLMQEKEEKYSKFIFGVLGLDQYHFFKSIYPENRIVDVTNYSLEKATRSNEKDYRLLCENEKQALFHVNRIQMSRRYLLFEHIQLSDDRSDRWSHAQENLYKSFMSRDIAKVTNFVYARGLDGKNGDGEINLIHADLKSGDSATIIHGHENLKKFFDYHARSARHDDDDRIYFAVLGLEQYNFFTDSFHRQNCISFVDISQSIPDEKLDSICERRSDVTYHARRIDLIRDQLKEKMLPPTSAIGTTKAGCKRFIIFGSVVALSIFFILTLNFVG